MNELEGWKTVWQSLGETAWTARLGERVEHDTSVLRRQLVAQLGAMAISSTLVTVLAARQPRPEVLTLAAIVWGFNLVRVLTGVRERAGSLRIGGTGTEAFVVLTQRRLETALESARTARRTTWGLAAALAPACIWVYVQNADRYHASPWSAVVGFGTIVGVLAYVLATAPGREAVRERELEAFRREMEDARGG